ncbi:papain-like cysteine protease family protein [Rhodobium gokarnense]|uniref:Peptidase C39-like domain-containing protein n=1 Tax=Rhodobium gokarnense TaxID=364296 RepID=A0ABT3HED0_9HYPH|nr:papain-like cysteine protease family protein [Rhodobium gokarnense]MCW2308735.1 hypothetical protein [Rhodobium gokarnense]
MARSSVMAADFTKKFGRLAIDIPARISLVAKYWYTVISRVLPLNMQHQQQTNWCWSAVGTSVGLFFQTGSWTQCDTANGCLGYSDCCNNPVPSPCNVYGYLDRSLTYTKSFASMTGSTASAATIESQINTGYPVCVRVAWTGGGAHFLSITGYSFPVSNPSNVTIYLEDSIYGTTSMPLADFPAQYHGGGTWTHTYYTKPTFSS